MTTVRGEIHIDAPPQKVWHVIADLGSIATWNPAVANAYYTSDVKHGVGASRHCDFPDGTFVEESVTEWTPGASLALRVEGGDLPFDHASGAYQVRKDNSGTAASFALTFDLKPDAPVALADVERENRDELIPLILAALKHFVETGQPMPLPAMAS